MKETCWYTVSLGIPIKGYISQTEYCITGVKDHGRPRQAMLNHFIMLYSTAHESSQLWSNLTLRGQLSQLCDPYMHLVKLTSWKTSKLQLMLINRTFLCKPTSSDNFQNVCAIRDLISAQG